MGLSRWPGVSEAPVPWPAFQGMPPGSRQMAGCFGSSCSHGRRFRGRLLAGSTGLVTQHSPGRPLLGRPPLADDALVKVCCLLFARGWRIQWSIVPEVSEVVVSRGRGSAMGSGCAGGRGLPEAPRASCVGASREPCLAGSAQRGDGWLLPPRVVPG